MDLTWDAVEKATSYEVEFSTDGTNYDQLWAGPYTDCNLSELPTTKMYYRMRARNANGYGPFSDVLSYDFTIPIAAPTNLAYDISTMNYTWNQVPAGQSYQLHWKHIDQETWTIVEAGSGNSYYQPYPFANFLAKIRALRYFEFGPFSEELSFNVPEP